MAHPMRIAIVTDFYYPTLGGISEHVDGQARALTDLGHEVTVVTGRKLGAPPVQDDAMAVPEPTCVALEALFAVLAQRLAQPLPHR